MWNHLSSDRTHLPVSFTLLAEDQASDTELHWRIDPTHEVASL